jgi:hypothetical protein
MGYWQQVIKGGWSKTYLPLGWDRKKVALALVTVLGAVVIGIHYGLDAMMASIVPIMWTALPVILAAAILFVWGIIETQAKLYSDLSTSTATRIAELEAAISGSKEPTPDYESYRHVARLTLRDAAFLWTDIRVLAAMTPRVRERYAMLCGAIQTGDLKFIPRTSDPYMRDVRIRMERDNPRLDTIVTRTSLKEFAVRFGYDPIFLRDAPALG